jgi:hypothetical protein
MDKLTLSTQNTLAIGKLQRQKFTKYLSTKGAGKNGAMRITTSMDPLTEVVLRCRPNGLSITFNPSKLYYGKNFEQVSLPQLVEVVDFLSEYYEMNLREWNVAGFDWCENITTNHLPERYISQMGKLKAYTVEVYHRTGKTYHTRSKTKTITLYNKVDEMRYRKEDIPTSEVEANILRVEVSINKAPRAIKQLSAMCTLKDYLTPGNYVKLPQLWVAMFNQIETNEHLTHLHQLTEREQTLVLFLEKFGWNGYREKLRVDYKKARRTLSRRLKELDNLQAKMITHTPESLVKELREKVARIAQQREAEALAMQPFTA